MNIFTRCGEGQKLSSSPEQSVASFSISSGKNGVGLTRICLHLFSQNLLFLAGQFLLTSQAALTPGKRWRGAARKVSFPTPTSHSLS